MQFIEDALFPTLGKVRFRVKILSEEAVFVRYAQKIERRHDQIQMRDQNALGKVFAEVVITAHDALPEARTSFSQDFLVHLIETSSNLEALVNLVGFQLANGNTADDFSEGLFPEAAVNVRNLHEVVGYHASPVKY